MPQHLDSVKTMNNDTSGQVICNDNASLEIEKVRSILVEREREEIKRLHLRIDDLQNRLSDTEARAADASEVLSAATRLTIKRDDSFSDNFKPIIVEQFQRSSRENPEIMAEALFPVLGPAIRKMIASLLTIDSKKTKRSYRFEQLFLIEKESGLPICHASSSLGETRDADMVSGMLSAIQSFVQDAFSTQDFDGLNTLQLGELSVWIEWGPEAVVAAVIRGVAPERCRTALQELLEDIHSEYAKELEKYEGDASPFDPLIDNFLLFMENHDGRLKNRIKSLPYDVRKKLAIGGMLTLIFFAWTIYSQYDQRKWNRFVLLLDAQPGIVVTGSERRNGRYFVRGLRDPLAADVDSLLSDSGLDKDRISFNLEPYKAMQAQFNTNMIKSPVNQRLIKP